MDYLWQIITLLGAANRSWTGVCSSYDARYIYACTENSGHDVGFFVSSNYGVTWSLVDPSGRDIRNWTGVACDPTGQYVVAISQSGMFISTNYGSTWTENFPCGEGVQLFYNHQCVFISYPLLAVGIRSHNPYLLLSTNFGVSWTPYYDIYGPSYANSTACVACSADGSCLLSNDGQMYTINRIVGGVGTPSYIPDFQYSPHRPTGFPFCAMSRDGQRMFVAFWGNYDNDGLGTYGFLSVDNGNTWNRVLQKLNHPNQTNPGFLAGDPDLNTILLGVSGGRLNLSIDGGNTFTEENNPLISSDLTWNAGAVSSDKTKLFAGNAPYGGGYLYGAIPAQLPTPIINPDGGTFTEPVAVILTDVTEGATIHYTLDGSVPTETSTLYINPITLIDSKTVKAIAVKDGYTNSLVASADFIITWVPSISRSAVSVSKSVLAGQGTRDFKLNISDGSDGTIDGTQHDLAVEEFQLVLIDGIEQLKQQLRIRLQFFAGEWYLDTTVGVRYFQDVMIKNPQLSKLQSLFKAVIVETEGVRELTSFNMLFDEQNRIFNLTFTVNTIYGNLTMQETI